MKIRKIKLILGLIVLMGGSVGHAQNPTPPTNIQEMMTPLKPADGRPYVFYSQAYLDAAKEKKTLSIKQDIRKYHENAERVKVLRENLWRLENAVVQELPK
jgi:hypothetical protein